MWSKPVGEEMDKEDKTIHASPKGRRLRPRGDAKGERVAPRAERGGLIHKVRH
ncbi:MAG: hypothetical protein KME30_18670 [Iphinoe sp. HA4291-MV1]|nr:hypothetical protein [Iphinoe sp. HA4291-MV1]